MKKHKTNEIFVDAAKRFSNAFFNGLKKNTADRIIKKAEESNLSPRAVKLMKDIENRSKELKNILEKV